MTQWWPDSSYEIIFNTLRYNLLIAKRMTLNGEVVREYNFPVQTVSSDSTSFISLNYRRLARLRPDYGYDVEVSNFHPYMGDDQDGLWIVNSETGRGNLIISLEILKAFQARQEMKNSEHKVNHVMFSPVGKRIIFMHRWIGASGKFSRLITANLDGSDLFLLADDRMVSHYAWQDDEHVLAWARMNGEDHFYLYTDQTDEFKIIGGGLLDVYGDGHPSYSPDKRWIVIDTYPGRDRRMALLIYDTKKNSIYEIGRFISAWKYRNEYRCDLHPRWSRDGLSIAIDSTHEGNRGLYLIDVSKIVQFG